MTATLQQSHTQEFLSRRRFTFLVQVMIKKADGEKKHYTDVYIEKYKENKDLRSLGFIHWMYTQSLPRTLVYILRVNSAKTTWLQKHINSITLTPITYEIPFERQSYQVFTSTFYRLQHIVDHSQHSLHGTRLKGNGKGDSQLHSTCHAGYSQQRIKSTTTKHQQDTVWTQRKQKVQTFRFVFDIR